MISGVFVDDGGRQCLYTSSSAWNAARYRRRCFVGLTVRPALVPIVVVPTLRGLFQPPLWLERAHRRPALPAAAGLSGVTHLHVQQGAAAPGTRACVVRHAAPKVVPTGVGALTSRSALTSVAVDSKGRGTPDHAGLVNVYIGTAAVSLMGKKDPSFSRVT